MGNKLFGNLILLVFLLQTAPLATAQDNSSETLEAQASSFFQKGSYAKAAVLFEKAATARKEEHPVDEKYAELLLFSGVSFDRSMNYAEAKRNYLSSYFIFKDFNKGKNKQYAIVCNRLALLFHTFADYDKAEYFYIRARQTYQNIYGKENADYAATCYNLARLYYEFGHYNRSESFFNEAKNIRQKVLGKSSLAFANSCGALARFYDDFGKYTEAESLYRQENYYISETVGTKHIAYANSCYKLGLFYKKMGKYKKSDAFLNEAKSIYEQQTKAKTLENARTDYKLGSIYTGLQMYDKALVALNRAKTVQEDVLGTQNPTCADTYYGLANLYRLSGNYETAAGFCSESKNVRQFLFGPNHPDYARACALQGLIFFNRATSEKSIELRLDKYAKADSLYKEARNIFNKLYGPNSLEYAQTDLYIGNLKWKIAILPASYLQKKAKYKQVLPYYLSAQKTLKNILGNINLRYLKISFKLAGLYTEMDDLKKAEALYLKVNRTYKNIYGEMYPSYIESCFQLADFYLAKDDLKNAGLFYTKAKHAIEKRGGKEDIAYTLACSKLAGFYQSAGYYLKAEKLFVEAKTINEKLRGNNKQLYAQNCVQLARLYVDMEQFEKAKSLYLQAKSSILRSNGMQSKEYASVCNQLGSLFLYMGDYQKSLQLYTQAKQIINSSLGKYNKINADIYENLSNFYQTKGYLAKTPGKQLSYYHKAVPYYKEAKDIAHVVYGDFDMAYSTSCSNLANMYLKIAEFTHSVADRLSYYRQAEQIFIEAKDVSVKAKGEHHVGYAESCTALADFYVLMANKEEDPKKKKEGFQNAFNLYHYPIGIYAAMPEKVYPFYTRVLEKSTKLSVLLGDLQQAVIGYVHLKGIYAELFGKEHRLYALSCIDLAVVYQNQGKPDKAAAQFIEGNTVLNALLRENSLFMDEQERLDLIKETSGAFDLIHSFFLSGKKAKGKPVDLVFNNNLLFKSALPDTYLSLQEDVKQCGDSILQNVYNQMNRYGQAWIKESKLTVAKRDSNIIELSGQTKLLEEEFAKLAKNNKNFVNKSFFENTNRIKIQNKLKFGETLIYFIKFYNKGQTTSDSTLYYALLLRKNDVYPKAIYLFEEKQLENLLNTEAKADSNYVKRLYSIKSPQRDSLYNLVFKRIEPYLKKTKRLYVSPTGLLNSVAFDAVIGRGRWTLSRWYDINYLSSPAKLLLDDKLYAMGAKSKEQLTIINKINIFPVRKSFNNPAKAYALYPLWELSPNLRNEFMAAFHKNWSSGMEIRKAFKETQKQLKTKYSKSGKAAEKYLWAAFALMR